jgi:transposase-like protein
VSEPIIETTLLPTRTEIRTLLHDRVIEAVEEVLREELTQMLGAGRYERSEARRGSRNGEKRRVVTTERGPEELSVPRGRVHQPDGTTSEFRSTILPRYARRTRNVDEAILGAYLSGANTRRIKKALTPLLGEANLSKSAVSRVVARLKELFSRWEERDLSEESYPILYLDAINVRVRLARRVVSVPVLVALGVDEEGQKRVVDLRLAVSESGAAWSGLVGSLGRRGLLQPLLVVTDGHAGLQKAIELWDEARVQRCTVHKLQNLLEHCPKHARPELKRDYHRIVYAKDGIAARKAYDDFRRKWSSFCPPVVRSLEEAGDHLLTFYEFPRGLWKAIRSTNSIENLNREFRRRTKTQASFSTEEAALTLLFGLIAFGQINLRRIDGYKHLRQLTKTVEENAA